MWWSGHMFVDQGNDVETLGGSGEGGDVAVLKGADAEAPGGSLEEPFEQGVGGAEVEHRDGAGLAVNAAGLDDAPVGAAVDDVSLQAGHLFCIYIKFATKSRENVLCSKMLLSSKPQVHSFPRSRFPVLCIQNRRPGKTAQDASGTGWEGYRKVLRRWILSKLTLEDTTSHSPRSIRSPWRLTP